MSNNIDTTCKSQKRALLVWVSRNTTVNEREIVDNFNEFWMGKFTGWRCIGKGFDNLHNKDGRIYVSIDSEGDSDSKPYLKKLKRVDLINAELDKLISGY